jgi:hypothetical protein
MDKVHDLPRQSVKNTGEVHTLLKIKDNTNTNNNQTFYFQASWGRLEMKPHEQKKTRTKQERKRKGKTKGNKKANKK